MSSFVFAVMALALITPPILGQEQTRRWERRSGPVEVPVTVFHSTQSANLPTAETLERGEWLFEISHRFLPPVSDGADALWGFDGPVHNRIGLAWAATDRLMVGLVRTNLDDNVDLNAKLRVAEGGRESIPWMLGVSAGGAFNTDAPLGATDNEVQAYGQAIVDLLLGGRVALGLVPAVVYNPVIRATSSEVRGALGVHGQLYLSSVASVFSEGVFAPSYAGVAAADLGRDSGSIGVELETGGHFFKVVLTNQVRMNPGQYLGGAPFEFRPREWRVGFNITRLLAF